MSGDSEDAAMQILYPSFDPDKRLARARTEKELFSNTDIKSVTGPALDEGDRALLVGVNDKYGVCLMGPADIVAEFGEANRTFERETYESTMEQHIRNLTSQKQVQRVMEELMAIAQVDPDLKPSISRLVKVVAEIRDDLPEDAEQTPAKPLERKHDAGLHSCLQIDMLPAEPTSEAGVEFRVYTCSTQGALDKPWKARNAAVKCMPGTVPAAALNANNFLAIAYQPCGGVEDDCYVDVFNLDTACKKPAHRFRIPLPRNKTADGFMNCYILPSNNIIVTYSFGVIYIRDFKDAYLHSIVHETRRGVITCANAVEKDNVLFIGTKFGEIFLISINTGNLLQVTRTIYVEPILSISVHNHIIMHHTIMGLAGTMAMGQGVALLMDRPYCVSIYGTVIATLNKYGSVQICSGIARTISRSFSPKEMSLQKHVHRYAYPAVHLSNDGLLVLYPDGQIRQLKL
jgi:hypothetical protein